ncbi:MAG: TerC family protein [Candidatus Eisenbacteria bacterium]|nr:TerC family protein [Candidatus Eisenbacteria bacterium]
METIGTPTLWIAFTSLILALLALDLGVFHRKAHEVKLKEAAGWSLFWIGLAGVFNLAVWNWFGRDKALEFATGYLIEKALSVDNIFVFVVLFASFSVPSAYQHRVLFWGIVGALVMRAIFILVGASLLERFHWVIYIFGGLLLLTGIKLWLTRGDHVAPEKNPIFRLFRRFVPAVEEYHGSKFTVVKDGKRYATPLLLVLAAIEATDLVFAVDSIPAIFAVTRDPFIVYTSNIFAILGLRALYFLLAGLVDRLKYLKYGLAAILVFVGGKMLLADVYKVPVGLSLSVIASILLISGLASWFSGPRSGSGAKRPAAVGAGD